MDASFDAVIVGGGSKGLVAAMYLAKYGGMSIGIFERLHEVGGGWCDEEPAPGFVGDVCSTEIWPWYHLPLRLDFPDFEEKGGKVICGKVSQGEAYSEDDSCLLFYHPEHDPSREHTVRAIASFSQRDAELYAKLWRLWESGLREAFLEMKFNPPKAPGKVSPLMKFFSDPKNRGVMDPHVNTMSLLQAGKVVWESKEIVSYVLRRCASAGIDPNQPGEGIAMYLVPLMMPESGGTVGGSHSTAHAAHRILSEYSARFFTQCEVSKILIENGKAKGIRLADGAQIEAKRLVVTDVDPRQLCLKLIGREHLSPIVMRKIEALESWRACGYFYQWALREPPRYRCAEFNRDVDICMCLVLGNRDLQRYVKEYAFRSLGTPIPEPTIMIYSHPYDRTRCPSGMWVGVTEAPEIGASFLTEEQWRVQRKAHAKYVIRTWSKYAENVNWDNVIGYLPVTPYDIASRLRNMAPNGNWITLDNIPSQRDRFRPIPELASHRTPVEKLYATGVAWGSDYGASSCQGYTCYKVIAQDIGLRKPWEEQGRAW